MFHTNTNTGLELGDMTNVSARYSILSVLHHTCGSGHYIIPEFPGECMPQIQDYIVIQLLHHQKNINYLRLYLYSVMYLLFTKRPHNGMRLRVKKCVLSHHNLFFISTTGKQKENNTTWSPWPGNSRYKYIPNVATRTMTLC